ncbi:hypothetical protein ONI72_002382 [Escherichia coli]|nr:hypothetical protein [Escherichia coli]
MGSIYFAGHNGIYPARTSEGRHCGYFIDWPGVCQGRESISMSIRTYAVNCNDAWLNTEGDDISGSYVKYKDHQEVVAALEAKCAKMAAENTSLKQSEKEFNDFCRQEYYGWEDNFTETPATDTFLDEVRAQGVEMAMEHMRSSGSLTFGDCYISLNEFAAQLRKGGNQ